MPDSLTTISYKNYDRLSRYQSFPYYYNKIDDKYIYGTTAQLEDNTPFNLHTITKGDTWDILALKYYNNPTLYWIILDYNKIQDPYIEPEVGSKIKIPILSSIEYKQ